MKGERKTVGAAHTAPWADLSDREDLRHET